MMSSHPFLPAASMSVTGRQYPGSLAPYGGGLDKCQYLGSLFTQAKQDEEANSNQAIANLQLDPNLSTMQWVRFTLILT